MKDDKRLKRKVRNSYIVSNISIALVLFLLGSVGYLMTAAMQVARTLQESVTVTVELRNGADEKQKESLRKRFEANELVSHVEYSSKDDKLNDTDFRQMFEQEFEAILEENPLLDSFELTLSADSADPDKLETFIAQIAELDGVDRVSYPAQTVERLHATIAKIRLVLLLFGGALLVISLILLNNTIRLAIFSKRYLINTEARRGNQMVHHATVPGQQHHTRHSVGNHRIGTLPDGRLRTERGGSGTDVAGRNHENRNHRGRHGVGRHPDLALLHVLRRQQVRQHEIQQDLSLLKIPVP